MVIDRKVKECTKCERIAMRVSEKKPASGIDAAELNFGLLLGASDGERTRRKW